VSGQLHAPADLLPGKKLSVTIGTGLDNVKGEKNSCLYRDSNYDASASQPEASRYTDCAIPAPRMYLYYSKPPVIRSNWRGEVIRISEAKGSPKRQKNLEHK
jgi:hypothetical protein